MTTPILLMGVSGSGKSTVARLLAERIDGVAIDADDLHSATNRAKMSSGTPLTDDDRVPWLTDVGHAIRRSADVGELPIVACSALRRRYRQAILDAYGGRIVFIHLDVDRVELQSRLESRVGHFMPSSLLDSQLATLEPLAPDEDGAMVTHGSPEELADEILALLPTLQAHQRIERTTT